MNYEESKEYRKVLSQLPKKLESPEFPGRPNRGVITTEDIMNLKIALNTANSLEEFVEMV